MIPHELHRVQVAVKEGSNKIPQIKSSKQGVVANGGMQHGYSPGNREPLPDKSHGELEALQDSSPAGNLC